MPPPRLRFARLKTVPPGLWRRVPPAIFPGLLGLLGLGAAWRAAAGAGLIPREAADLVAGLAVATAAFGLLAYAGKLARRGSVLGEELAVLPGRAGLAAAVLCLHLIAGLAGGYAPAAGRALLVAGLALQAGFVLAWLAALRRAPPPQRAPDASWHLALTGVLVAARAAGMLGWPGLAAALLWPGIAAWLAVTALHLARLGRSGAPPAPLRPLLANHLAPPALIAATLAGLGATAAAQGFAGLALCLLAAGLARAPWLLAAGPSPLWGALAFPLAATASAWLLLVPAGGPALRLTATALLALATLAVPPIAVLLLRDWRRGRLGAVTNAAIA